MGDWSVTVSATGSHGNGEGNPADAETLGAEFIRRLQAHGHHIQSAVFSVVTAHTVDLAALAAKPPPVFMSPEDREEP